MQEQSPSGDASTEARAASIKLVFKKAMLSKLGQSVTSVAEHLKDGDDENAAPETPKTAENKNEKKAAPRKKTPLKADASPPKATVSKATPSKASAAKSTSRSASSKGSSKKAAPQKQKRAEQNIDAASITSDLGRSVISSTAGLDLADSTGDAIPMNRVRRMMRELLGETKISNESVAAVVCSCHGFINYMANQAAQRSSDSLLRYDDLAAVVHDREYLEFLDEVLPERIAAEDAAAINFHLKLAPGVIINPPKQARVDNC